MVKVISAATHTLTQLYVYVTNICNCSCKHCWIISPSALSRQKNSHFIPVEAFEAAVSESKPLGLCSVKWTGGEPTLHPNLEEFLRIQKRYGLSGRIETNAMEITPALAKLFMECNINHISVSLDGATPETHDAIRGVQGSYCRARRGIKNLLQAGFKPQIIMSLMRENIKELEDLLSLAEKLGVGSVKLNIVQPTLAGLDLYSHNQALTVTELLEINQRVNTEFKADYPFAIIMDVPLAFRPLKSLLKGDGCSVCSIKNILGLLSDGNYGLCGMAENVPELVLARAGEGRLDEFWKEHPLLLKIREELPSGLKGICGRCLMKSICLGSCVAQNYYRSQDILGAFWFCEEAQKQGLFPQTRLQ